jgi:hypothetical protein
LNQLKVFAAPLGLSTHTGSALMRNMILSTALIPCLAVGCPLRVEPTATSASVVELYTSEGCSSCPPAELWLGGQDSVAMLLAFHVDYWDDLGWPDRFASKHHSERQRWRASLTRARSVYTPQVVVNGTSTFAWREREPLLLSPSQASFTLAAEGSLDAELRVAWKASVSNAWHGATMHLALTESALQSRPTRGENSGRVLQHQHVVRAHTNVAMHAEGELVLAVPKNAHAESLRANLWVESQAGMPLHALVLNCSAR